MYRENKAATFADKGEVEKGLAIPIFKKKDG